MQKLKTFLENRLSFIILALIAIQPPLDVLSFFLSQRENTTFSTLLRFAMLAAVALLGFLLSDAKRVYLILYAAVGVFWLAHVANCYRIGYTSLVKDTGNLLRMMNFPIFSLTFITMLGKTPGLRRPFLTGVVIAYGEILLFTALPWLTGHPVYTYDVISVGVLGWFSTPSAQSAIIVLITPLLIYWTYHTGKYLLYLLGVTVSVGMMFIIGTKLNFYSIFIFVGAFIFLFILQLGKKSVKYALPLIALAVLVVVFRHQSPMAVRERLSAQARNNYDALMEESLENSGADDDVRELIDNDGEVEEDSEPKPVPTVEKRLALMRRALMGIYADDGVYGFTLMNPNKRFGVYNVMQAYHHTDAPGILSDTRQRKLYFAKMMWAEKDTLTHFLGFEYSDFFFGQIIHDLENDFPGIFYNTGYIGFAMYLAFFAVFVFAVLRAFAGEMQRGLRAAGAGRKTGFKSWVKGFWLGLRHFLTIETGTIGMSFLLAMLAAQISGSVLRRPNVTIYFAIVAAYIFSLTVNTPGPEIKGRKTVFSKKIKNFGLGRKGA